MIHYWLAVILSFHLIFLGIAASEDDKEDKEITGLSIIQISESRIKAKSEKTIYRMDLIDEKGKVRKREMTIYFKRYPDKEITLLKFTTPSNLKGVGMMIEDTGKSINNIWTYIPVTRRLRRLSGQQKRNWFMGTEFTYEDFEDYQIPFYSFTLVKRAADHDGVECFVVEAVPKTKDVARATGYAKKVYWIDRTSYYPVKIELFDKQVNLWKVFTAEDIRKVGDYYRPKIQTMHNLANNRRTRLVELTRKVDQPLKDYYLSLRFLRTE